MESAMHLPSKFWTHLQMARQDYKQTSTLLSLVPLKCLQQCLPLSAASLAASLFRRLPSVQDGAH